MECKQKREAPIWGLSGKKDVNRLEGTHALSQVSDWAGSRDFGARSHQKKLRMNSDGPGRKY
jgi:hypothetical protein